MKDTRAMILYICGIPESDTRLKDFYNIMVSKVKEYSDLKEVIELYKRQITRDNVIYGLDKIARFLEEPGNVGFIYYFGHGDQIRDTDRDESDGKDEIWKLCGGSHIVDDEISRIFRKLHNKSKLILFSDSCSSGTMMDRSINNRNWVSFTSCRDHQDSLSSVEGGVCTLWGYMPALKQANKDSTPQKVYNHIKENIQIPTQHPQLNSGNSLVLKYGLFKLC
jgi:hypothetical protein